MENTPKTPIKLSTKQPYCIKPMTAEERQAIAQRRVEEQRWAEEHLKLGWMDEGWMREIANEAGLKLAAWHYPAFATKYIRRALKAVGKDGSWHKDVFGFTINDWNKVNPKHPAWVAQCLIVEQAMLEKQRK